MKSSFVFFLLYCGTTVCQIRQYVYINQGKTWSDAQSHCKENYVDLATITTPEEDQRLRNAANSANGWIWLNRTAPGSNIWQWSDGQPANFFLWAPGQPDSPNTQSCGMVHSDGWHDQKCTDTLPFYCSRRFVLVKDSKTWNEALEYCRTYYIGVVSPISLRQNDLATNAIVQTQTVSMWAGLHFVDGRWVSVNNVTLMNPFSQHSCPAVSHRCGALNNKTLHWENRECNEKLNFLCY